METLHILELTKVTYNILWNAMHLYYFMYFYAIMILLEIYNRACCNKMSWKILPPKSVFYISFRLLALGWLEKYILLSKYFIGRSPQCLNLETEEAAISLLKTPLCLLKLSWTNVFTFEINFDFLEDFLNQGFLFSFSSTGCRGQSKENSFPSSLSFSESAHKRNRVQPLQNYSIIQWNNFLLPK